MKNRTWVELSRENTLHNVQTLRGLVGDGRIICSAVKANAYGHGVKEMSPLILEGGADWLGVDSLAEALEIRANGVDAPVYIMGYIELDELETAVKEGFHFVVYNRETFDRLKEITERLGIPALTHLKLETGTNRQGVSDADLPQIIRNYRENVQMKLVGVSTHFANIEDTTDPSYAAGQQEEFNRMISVLKKGGLEPEYKHCANSAATILFPQTYYNFIRPGIANYGLWPSKETLLSARQMDRVVELKPVLSWKTKVAEVKDVPSGRTISYGCTYKTMRDSKIALILVGYCNGFSRELSSRGHFVLIGGRRAPILGRVMMNMTIVDVTDIPGVKPEDEVVLIGRQGDERISAEDVATAQGTINYEVTTQINPMIERRVV
ncbi:alanine racemase [Patescibacteria group bacterium]|nr:alanine racemase [Patescibacteria group bacterium]